MKKWLLIYDDGDPLDQKRSVTIHQFTSGDDDEPFAGDLSAAVESLAAAVGDRRDPEKLSVMVIPLEAARTLSYRRGGWEAYAEGNIA